MEKPMRKALSSWAIAGALVAGAASLLAPSVASAEPASCLSFNPSDWPPSSKPYFMLIADTSGSMTSDVGNPAVAPSCGAAYGTDRRAHLRCAIKNTVQAFAGQVNFGLATYPRKESNCSATCFANCQYTDYPNNATNPGCGPGTGASRRGAFIQVPMLQDSFWQVPPPADNTAALLATVDNNCTGNTELFADGFTPLNGALRDMKRYFSTTGWTAQDNSVVYPTPLASQDLTGTGVNGSTACRPVNIIFITDGGETCDTTADAVNAAADLYNNGVVVGGKTWKIRTYMINFAGGGLTESDQIAAAGGTGASVLANDETALSIALSNIISGAIKPESCNNADDNCNGCTDEGFKHYCDVGQTCCPWNTGAQRLACLTTYTGTITAANPTGDLTKLPCTTVAQQADPQSWLCYDPKETCDNTDNNCNGTVDENVLKCGNPAHCPTAEVCNGLDDNCNGVTDEAVCNGCVPSPEVCDGCDNDCDGLVDEGIADVPCGLANPLNCAGTLVCPQKANPGNVIGACPGGGYNQCTNNPQTEVCDSIDNNCDGIVDNGAAATPCVPAGQPNNLNYGPNSQCKQGSKACGSNQCIGFVGPSTEVCDGIDNDCDGVVDDNVFGVNLPCGLNQAPCTPGLTACVNGALICQGGTGPQAEVCDGLDNNCNGVVDDAPLADAPAQGMNGCWALPGNCCTFKNLQWCPPPGADCTGAGTLTPPCGAGTLACAGAAGWVCQGSKGPAAETCDGLDNNCNGQVDDGSLPQVGTVCGSDTGECKTGVLACAGGVLDCVGDVPPSPELCDNLDNDCDGVVDNGIQLGGTCTPSYDPQQYPNPPVFAPCMPGVLKCDGAGNTVCDGGIGPSPEVCDGLDNDCDGEVDEPGNPPNGIDGSADPNDMTHVIGQPCGVAQGACSGGVYACVAGQVKCSGGTTPQPEECDCKDNDCDGQVDNGSGLCSSGKDCVNGGSGKCGCAEPCGGEFPCPPGQECVLGTKPDGTQGSYCFPDFCPNNCKDAKVVEPGTNKVVCGPEGTPADANCVTPPVCACKDQSGCQEPCYGVVCDNGAVCTNYGDSAGKCVTDNCYNVPCVGCDSACHAGGCTDNPCVPNPCKDGETCKPNADFTDHVCVPSCADKTCGADEACVNGECKPTCSPACTDGKVCDTSQNPPVCVDSKCMSDKCADGSCCDPLTGNCGDCPCSGVVCPSGQECRSGDCFTSGTGGGGGDTGGTGGTTMTTTSSTTTTGTDTTPKGGWGLATGGGGCSCRTTGDDTNERAGLVFAALAIAIGASRRRRRGERDAA
ncbi:MAG: MopE-related protein [Polyangiaceae bacterium]